MREAASVRLDVIQLLRGVAALVVCLAHIVRVSPLVRYPRGLDMLGDSGDIGVYGFFLISGLVVPWSLYGQGYSLSRFPRYLARRLVRLDPPYLVTIVIALSLAAYRTFGDNPVFPVFPYSWSTIGLHLGYLTGIARREWILPVFWTLGIEFQFYILVGLLFPALMRLMEQCSARNVWPPTFAWLWLLTIVPTMVQMDLSPEVKSVTWFSYHQFFAVGFSLFLLKKEVVHWSLPVLVTLLSVGRGGLAGNTDDVILVRNVLLALTMSAAIGLTSNHLEWVRTTWHGRLLSGLGAVSYSLYLTHILVVGRITSAALARGWVGRTDLLVLVFLSEAVVAIVTATLFYVAVERPAVGWSRAISYSASVGNAKSKRALVATPERPPVITS